MNIISENYVDNIRGLVDFYRIEFKTDILERGFYKLDLYRIRSHLSSS